MRLFTSVFRALAVPLLAASTFTFYLGGSPAPLSAASCITDTELLCKENEACVGMIFFRQCTTTYEYGTLVKACFVGERD